MNTILEWLYDHIKANVAFGRIKMGDGWICFSYCRKSYLLRLEETNDNPQDYDE